MDNMFTRWEHHFALPTVAEVPFLRCFDWISGGWEDLRRSPMVSLAYGLIISLALALVLSFGMRQPYLFTASISGFLLIAPLFAVGLYEISRRHDKGEPVTFMDSLTGWRRNSSSIGLFAVFLAIVAIAWERLSAIMFAMFFGGDVPDLGHFAQEVLFSGHYDRFAAVYMIAGAALAALVFAVSAVSLPMMMDRDTDVATAMMASVKAVATNPAPMVLWAVSIVVLAAIGFATFLIGMIFIMPLLGHATWHAYKELIK